MRGVGVNLVRKEENLLMALQIDLSSNHLHTWNKAHISHKRSFSKKFMQPCHIRCSSITILHAQRRDGLKVWVLP